MPDQSYAAIEHALLEEITRPLERLPEDPLELVQPDFPTAMRGYDKAAVDDYVFHTTELIAELQAVRSPESAVRRALVRAGGQISGVLRRAHEIAAEITARSRSEAEDRLERARVEADEVMDAAERRVRDLDTDTDRIWLDRQRIMVDVEDLSNQLLELARQAGERFPDDDEHAAYDQEQAEPPASGDRRSESGVDNDKAHEEPVPHDQSTARDDGGTALTDRDETMPLAAPDPFELAEPPEVEPRSGRLRHEHGSPVQRGDGGSGSAGMITPMSEAANRPRRS